MPTNPANRRLSNVIGFDDAPFPRGHRGPVTVVGAVFAELRFDGLLITEIEKDGVDATSRLAGAVMASKFAEHAQLLMLQGIAMGGFNVVDIAELRERTGMPVLVVARRAPDMGAIRDALLDHVDGGAEKWALIQKAGPMAPVAKVWVQRAGLSVDEAADLIRRFAVYGHIPEPIRYAHLIAGAIGDGVSRGRV